MEFKTTSTNRRHRRSGMTLVEVLIASGIGGMVVAMLMAVTLHTSRTVFCLTDSVGLNSQSRYAIDRMSQKIRQATNITDFSSSSISMKYNGHALAYRISDGALVEIDDGRTNRLVQDCKSLTFNVYKRNPIANTFNQFPTLTHTNEAKVVQINWQGATTRVGKAAGQGEMFSARIVLRAK